MKHLSLILAACLLASSPSFAADAARKEKKEQKTERSKDGKKEKKQSRKARRKGDKDTAEKPDTTVKEKPQVDMDGLFHVVKEKDEWYFLVADSIMGREMLVTVRYTGTPSESGMFGGEQVNQQTVYFEKAPDKQLLLRSRLTINVADSTEMISRAIRISNESPIIGSFKVESHEGGMNKIKVGQFFAQDNQALGLPKYVRDQYQLQGMVGEMSFVESIRSYPMNTEVRTVKTYTSNGSALPAARATGKVTFGLNMSFVMLPEKPMMRRFYDPRVGFFAGSYNSYTDAQQRVEDKTFIARWRLEPRPEDVDRMRRGELVEPRKPIVYYIDPATPKQWRKYLIMGVNDWQAAFEKAGFKNAIRAEEWPENDPTMSMEDARYSCIRYLASPIPNAYGPNVHDPRTGEIIESHICWYHNVMSLVHDWYMIQASSIDEAARKMNYDEVLMGQLIRFVSSHEVGHTLGLRHNFGSSSTVPVDSLRSKTFVERYGHTPSIMDYARFNYVAQPEDGIVRAGIFPRIGDYDEWAITWGYRPMLDARDEYEDHAMLEPLVLESLKDRRLWWGDGEGTRIDPRCQTEDLGDDAVKATRYGILNLQRLMAGLEQYTADDEKDIYGNDLSTMYHEIRQQLMRYCGHVTRNIGGYLREVKTRGMQGDVYAPQPREKQKQALAYLDEAFFHEPVWMRDVPFARRMYSDPQNMTLQIASNVIYGVMNRASSLNELYQANEYLSDLTRLVFSEAAAGRKVTPYRKELQNIFVERMIYLMKYESGDLRAAALQQLQQMQKQARSASTSSSDSATRAHWASIYDTIGRALSWN